MRRPHNSPGKVQSYSSSELQHSPVDFSHTSPFSFFFFFLISFISNQPLRVQGLNCRASMLVQSMCPWPALELCNSTEKSGPCQASATRGHPGCTHAPQGHHTSSKASLNLVSPCKHILRNTGKSFFAPCFFLFFFSFNKNVTEKCA